ncbi:MAG TPA: helix-turn-helix transcriptional regulator [Actinophytocola sp.]|uniref:helix-turn-helix domain-containing protein n=1 Tax=Actinophytocola sp. TaxID=1872138 RepID=UPI002DFE1B12|nr:helix-turn-helix transcriptional regulator [Actinophytocola sp.]
MITQQKPPLLRRRLGSRLRSMREQARLSMNEAAARLDMSRSALWRVETGESRMDVHLARSMMDVYDIYEEGLLDQVREALRPQWFRHYRPEDMGYVDLETEACAVCEFAVLNLPGLLQTEAYMRELFTMSTVRRTQQELDNQVEVRLIRRQRLTSDEDPLELVAVIDESALRREVGGPDVMRTQLCHLVEAADQPAVTVQVLPLRGGPHLTVDGAFILLSFPEPDEPDMQYVSYSTGSLHIDDQGEVAAAKLTFDRLRSEALSPADSLALIKQVGAELYGT